MKFSLGKTLWKIWLRFFDVFIKLFSILDLVLFILIIFQVKPDLKDFEALFFPYLLVVTIDCLILLFPIWIQGIYLWMYFKFGHQLILKLLSSGVIDYNFVWSLPKWINDLIGVSIRGEFINFVFWSGFVLSALFLIDRFERWFLIFLAKKMKIGWARELLEERLAKSSKAQKKDEGIIEVEKKEGLKDNENSLPPFPKEIKERIVFKPKFFRDRLWYQLLMFLLITLPALVIMGWSFSNPAGVKGASKPLLIVFGGTFLLVFLIFLPFFLWEVTARVILEKDKIIIKTFFFKKIIFYRDIKSVDATGAAMEISYEKQIKGKRIYEKAQFFPWPFTTEKVLKELKLHLYNIDINEDFILKRTKFARGLTGIIVGIVTVVLFCGFMYYIIYKAENRPKLSDVNCANRLVFWINDKPKTGILEIKEGFKPELSIKSPFYFFIDAEKSAPECDKNISFVIYNAKGNIVFRSGNLTTPKEGIVYYYWEAIFKEKGDYFLKVNYGNIPAKKINFSVK
jgi:hypothetical protein